VARKPAETLLAEIPDRASLRPAVGALDLTASAWAGTIGGIRDHYPRLGIGGRRDVLSGRGDVRVLGTQLRRGGVDRPGPGPLLGVFLADATLGGLLAWIIG
jgi:hypothetical protein